MHYLLLFWLVICVLFHSKTSSPAQYSLASPYGPPPTHTVTSPGLNGASRDKTSLIVTQRLGLPQLFSHPTIPLSVHYALNLFFRAPDPFTLCSEHTRRPVLLAISRNLILLLLCSSGDVEVNPGPAAPSITPIPQALSFVDFCNRKSIGFMLTLEASSLSLFYSLL